MHGQPIYVCNVCGKESKQGNMKNHIEANHLEGISVPCNFCEKLFRSRNATPRMYHYYTGANEICHNTSSAVSHFIFLEQGMV